MILSEYLEYYFPGGDGPVVSRAAEEEEPMLDFDFEEMIPSKDDTEE